MSLRTQEDIEAFLQELAVQQRELRDDIASIQWHMRGGLSMNEAWSLCWDQRLDVKKLVKDRIGVIKDTGLPLL